MLIKACMLLGYIFIIWWSLLMLILLAHYFDEDTLLMNVYL